MSHLVRYPGLLWAGVAVVALFELGTAGLFLRPHVDPTYRAYYIDKTSDCWPHDTDGHYALGSTASFVGAIENFAANKVCGLFYPSKSGTWSYGRFTELRFQFSPTNAPLQLSLEAGAMVDPAHPVQRVEVAANGQPLGTLSFDTPAPAARTLVIPAALAATGKLELKLNYPDARPGTDLGPNEDPHLRAIQFVAATIAPAK